MISVMTMVIMSVCSDDDCKHNFDSLSVVVLEQACMLVCNRYLRYTLDKYVENDYTVVYFHFGLCSTNKPSVSWLKRAYNEFDRK